MPQLFAVGDSHSTYFEQAGLMKSHWCGPIHVATIYQLLKKGLNLHGLREQLATSEHYVKCGGAPWQFPNGIYETPNITPGDTVLFCYGFNDMQKNIYKYAGPTYIREIDDLLVGYFSLIKEYAYKYQITPIILSIPPNPIPGEIKIDNRYGLCADFHTTGSSEKRHIYNLYANNVIALLCDAHHYNFKFLNLYEDIADADGFLRRDYTGDGVHLEWNIEPVKKIIEAKIDSLNIMR